MSTRRSLAGLGFWLALMPLWPADEPGKVTGLDRYVQAPDANYHYDLVKTVPGNGYTTYVLK